MPLFFSANLPSFMLNADRIVGGQDATSEIPWQVSVRAGINTNLQGGHWCGGTILDAKTILSAGHCFTKEQSVDSLSIRAGSLKKDSGGQVIRYFKLC